MLKRSGRRRIRRHSSRGFTILLAALVASVVLALSSSIFIVAQKQLILSSISRDSQYAFYAADTGAECALYWDNRHDAFGPDDPETPPQCDGKVLDAKVIPNYGTGNRTRAPYAMSFKIDFFTYTSLPRCVEVTIFKSTIHPLTTIRSDGYSTSCDDLASDRRSLQRSVELTF